MASAYRLQVVHNGTEKIAAWAPGLEREHDLIDDLCARVQAKHLAAQPPRRWYQWRDRPIVLRIDLVHAAVADLLHELKAKVPPTL